MRRSDFVHNACLAYLAGGCEQSGYGTQALAMEFHVRVALEVAEKLAPFDPEPRNDVH